MTSLRSAVASNLSPAISAATSISSCSLPSNYSPRNPSIPLCFPEGDSDDEIVWGVSEGSFSPAEDSEFDNASASDNDYVVLSRPRSPAARLGAINPGMSRNCFEERGDQDHSLVTTPAVLETAMKTLSLTTPDSSPKRIEKDRKERMTQQPATSFPEGKSWERKAKKNLKTITSTRPTADAYPSPAPSPTASKVPRTVHGTPDWFEEMSMIKFTGLGARPIVDDCSDKQSVVSFDGNVGPTMTLYEEASTFISRFLSNPDARDDVVCKLTLLQSLIIELGLAPPSLPDSLSAAKAFLKSRAFLNIREYLAVREQGPEAVRGLLHPSRKALIKDIRKKRNPASLKWVKKHGLQVLLVGWVH